MAAYGQRTRQVAARSRERARASRLMQLLTECAEGQREMTMAQIRAAVAVLNRLQPELKAIEFTGNVTHRTAEDLPLSELEAIVAAAASRGARAAAEETGAGEPDPVH